MSTSSTGFEEHFWNASGRFHFSVHRRGIDLPQSRHERGSPRGMKNLCRLPPWFEDVGIVNGTSKSAQSLTRELEEPRIVAASTPSRIFDDKLLRTT